LTFYFHFDFPVERKKTNLAIKGITEIFERCNVKGQYGITGEVVQNLAEDYPKVMEKIKKLKMPISYHGDQVHVPNPIREAWHVEKMYDYPKELIKVTWKYETHRLDIKTGEIIPKKIGGYLGVQKILGVIPLPTDVVGKGGENVHEYILRRMGAYSYPINLPYGEDNIDEIICYPSIHEPHFFPESPSIKGPCYFGKEPGEDAPMTADPIEWLKILAENMPREKVGRISFMCHNDIDFAKFEKLVTFALSRPDDFKIVWPDMEANQYKQEYSPVKFYKDTYGIDELENLLDLDLPPFPKGRKLTKKIMLEVANYLLSYWPLNTHWGDFGGPPNFIDFEEGKISLAEAFQGFIYSLEYYSKNDRLPDEVKTNSILGPVDTPMAEDDKLTPEIAASQGLPPCSNGAPFLWAPLHTIVEGEDVLKAALKVAEKMKDRVPAVIKLKAFYKAFRGSKPKKIEVKVNSAEFLYALAQEYRMLYLKNKLMPAAMVSMKVIEAQPGGVKSPPDPENITRGLGSYWARRGLVSPLRISADWTALFPNKKERERMRFMSTPFTDIKDTAMIWKSYNQPR